MAPLSPVMLSDRALNLMRELGVSPSPRHYHLFFAFASGSPAPLAVEMEMLIANHAAFTSELMDRLYHTYLADEKIEMVDHASASMKKILTEMVATMASFTGATQETSARMANELGAMSEGELTPEKLKRMAGAVIEGAKSIKQSSDAMEKKLEVAQKEVVALKENLTRATEESERDFLTSCYNRKAFDARLAEAVEEANFHQTPLTLLMIDVDHFKRFNDSFGHQVGDEVLKIVAKVLTDSVKGMDTVARFGGEEFAVILPRTPIAGGMIVAEGIRRMMAHKELKRRSSGENYGALTVSVGVSSYQAGADTPTTLIQRADAALYHSKKTGRNRVTREGADGLQPA